MRVTSQFPILKQDDPSQAELEAYYPSDSEDESADTSDSEDESDETGE